MEHRDLIRREFSAQSKEMEQSVVFNDTKVIETLVSGCHLSGQEQLLEVGCGPGIMVSALAPLVQLVTAIDITRQMLDVAGKRAESQGLSNVVFLQGDAGNLPFKNDTFDVVFSRFTLHHLKETQQAISEMKRVLKCSGRIVLADVVASEESAQAELHNALETLRDPSHVRMLSLSEFRKMAKEAGLKIAEEKTWAQEREYSEWIKITNAQERVFPIECVMKNFAKAGVSMGIDLSLKDEKIRFKHRFAMLALIRIPVN